MALQSMGQNHASGLVAMDNKDLQLLMNQRLSNYVIRVYQHTLPINLFLSVDMDVDLCGSISYLCEDTTDQPHIADSALDALVPRQQISAPRVVSFNGFCMGGFETKISKEQLECISQSEILRNWYQSSLMQAVERGKDSLMARFYRHLLVRAVHPKNTGMAAGLESDPQVLGTPTNPVILTPENIDVWYVALLSVIRQMPRSVPAENQYGLSTENSFLFGPTALENLNMKNPEYNSWMTVGECASCGLFSDTFQRMPRGIMPITSYCIEKRQCKSGGKTRNVYPVLFGKRFLGTKASLRVDTTSYDSLDGGSHFFKTNFYWSIHTYDCRFMGLSWITIEDTQPETVACDT